VNIFKFENFSSVGTSKLNIFHLLGPLNLKIFASGGRGLLAPPPPPGSLDCGTSFGYWIPL